MSSSAVRVRPVSVEDVRAFGFCGALPISTNVDDTSPVSAESALTASASLTTKRSELGVLDRLVQVAREVTGARYAVALLIGPDGAPSGLAHAGLARHEVAALPSMPRPAGLVATVLRGQTIRLQDLGEHPGAGGFPAGHLPMQALLGTPLMVRGALLGTLYVAGAPGDPAFSAADEVMIKALAVHAGAAVASLRAQRAAEQAAERIGVAPHHSDGETTLTIRWLLVAAREALGAETTYLTRIADGNVTVTHIDGTGIAQRIDEGLTAPATESYCQRMLRGEIPQTVPDVAAHPLLGPMAATSALGIGAYTGVPVRLPDGSLHGTLCGLDSCAGVAPTDAQLQSLRTIAGLIGVSLARQQKAARDKQAQAAALTTMLSADRSSVHLQPIFDLRSGQLHGFEALTRYTDAHGAPQRTDQVFARAASLGLGTQFELAAAYAALRWLPNLPEGTYLSVNLSPAVLLTPGAFDLLTTALRSAPRRLLLELTEHEEVPDYPTLLNVLDGLRQLGMRLAVDDMGSGFSSLQHATRLRPDVVKLDLAFVRDVHRDHSRRAIARALTAFASDIGAELVAEGIETEDERQALLAIGAAYGQGYLLGRPQPAAEALRAASVRVQPETSAPHTPMPARSRPRASLSPSRSTCASTPAATGR